MFRSAIGRRLRPADRSPRRRFHVSHRSNSEYVWHDTVEMCATKAYQFHNLFQYLHDSTGLPFLVSIPLVTVLLRSLITPLRYRLALRRREQREVIPQLQFEATVIAKQAERRIAAGVETREQTDIWLQKKWELKINEAISRHPRAKPTILVNPHSSFDAANVGAAIFVFANTSTILAQSISHPATVGLVMLDGYTFPLAACFDLLAILNLQYYHGKVVRIGDLAKESSGTTWNPFIWNSLEGRLTAMVIIPSVAAIYVALSPPAVVLSLLSSSIYTFLERKYIDSLVTPPHQVAADVSITPQAEENQEQSMQKLEPFNWKAPR